MLRWKGKYILVAVLIFKTSLNLFGHGTTTHATISSNAYGGATNIQVNFFQALGILPAQPFVVGLESRSAHSWIVQGSIREDTGTLPIGSINVGTESVQPRAIFHFFDPRSGQGLSGIAAGGILDVLSASPSPSWSTPGTGSAEICVPAILCTVDIQFSSNNDFPYSSLEPGIGARNEFFSGLTLPNAADRNTQLGLMFRSLGQTIHLIQDTAQPQHVRNDQHLDLGLPSSLQWFQNPSVYERYVDARPDLQSPTATYDAPVFTLPADFFANGSGAGMAEFANQNFVSAGTNCTVAFIIGECNSVGGYSLPVINNIDNETFVNLVYGGDLTRCQQDWAALFPTVCNTGVITFFGNNVHDANTGSDIENNRMTTFSIFDQFLIAANQSPVFTLNHFNYDQQATLLIPRATAYSAGLLNYFFRGSMLVTGSLNAGIQITNNTVNTPNASEDMNGTFSVYYERNDGTRQPVPGVPGGSASLLIPQGQTGLMPSFSVPPDAAQPVTFTLVFGGQLGVEDGAVAGKEFQVGNLTVHKSGSGSGTVMSSPPGITCGSLCMSQGSTFVDGIVMLTANADPGSVFVGWSGDCNGISSSAGVTVTQSQTCIATFNPATFQLTTIASDGGSITSSPAGIDCSLNQGSCLANFADGASVALTATAQAGFAFAGWNGDCSGTVSTTSVLLNGNKTCSATFNPQFASCSARFFVNTFTINSECPLDPGIPSFNENIVYVIEQTQFGHSGTTFVELLSQPDLGATFTNLVLFTTNLTVTPPPDQLSCEGGFTLNCPHPRAFPPSCAAAARYNNLAPDSISMNFTFFDVGPSANITVPSCFLPHCGSNPTGVNGEFCAQ